MDEDAIPMPVSGRGLMDQFHKEYSYWVRNTRVVPLKVRMEMSELLTTDMATTEGRQRPNGPAQPAAGHRQEEEGKDVMR